MMARKVFGIVLTLAVGIVIGFSNDIHAAAAGAFVVGVHVLNPDHHRRFQRDAGVGFDQNHCAVADVQLSSMVCNANAQGEPERLAQAVDRFSNVWIGKFWKHAASGH